MVSFASFVKPSFKRHFLATMNIDRTIYCSVMSAFKYAGIGADTAPFRVSFNACSRPPHSWKEESFAAARAIAEKASKPLFLCMSGGTLSDVMGRAFFEQGIHFSVVTFQHAGGTNEHDVLRAREWCHARGLHHNIVPVDIQKFLREDVGAYAARAYVALHPLRYLQLKLLEFVEEHNGYAVIGSGNPQFFLDAEMSAEKKNVYLRFGRGQVLPYEWCREKKTVHEPAFFSFAPEQYASYLREPLIAFTFEHPELLRHRANCRSLRNVMVRSLWPDMTAQPSHTGFENIKEETQATITQLRTRFRESLKPYRLPVAELESQLAEPV